MTSEALEKIDRAYDVVSALCEGKREWLMSIPARPDHDPDLIIGDALLAARNEIASLTRELEAARELLRELAGGDEAGLAWDRGWRCVYCDSRARYTVLHDGECPIVRARRVLANTDTAGPQSADREERRESD